MRVGTVRVMTSRFALSWSRLLQPLDARPAVFDAVFAAVVGLASLTGLLTASVEGSERAADGWGVALVVVMGVAFAARRRNPLTVLVIVCAAQTVFWVADYASNFDAYSLLVLYAATAHGDDDRRRVWIVAGTVIAVLTTVAVIGVLSPVEDLPAIAVAGILIVHLTAAVVGQLVYDRRRRILELEQRAARAETERELLARQAVLDERTRIARDMHDVVAHGMSVMVVQAGAAERLIATQPDRALEALSNIQAVGRQSLTEMRRMLGVLREPTGEATLMPQPTLGDLGNLVGHACEAGVPTELIVEGTCPERSGGIEMAAYRVVQEALTNVIRHAGRPVTAKVTVACTDDAIGIEIVDDGVGANGAGQEGTGHGLAGMRERVALYHGSFSAGACDGRGFRVRADIPLETQAMPR